MEPEGSHGLQIERVATNRNAWPTNMESMARKLLLLEFLSGYLKENGATIQILTNHLFEPRGAGFGLDLAALNIQRGRDHGIPNYNDWREFCGQPRITDFSQLADIMSPDAARAFAQVYRFPDDIDLFPAGINERPVQGGTVGPTFACIIAEQFRRMKNGDRFWYENGGLESSLNEVQVEEIRKASMARIICDNTNLKFVQPLAMIREASWNPKVDCNGDDIPRVDFDNWQNEPVWT
ncbi:hypothetical protein HPB48_018708 [Haemaphysalis longicornis]|uniref:Uncharacterized protein n=1 Tax=Haemaphysalis longicornis TaxID=44386 RepID=A0A9J6G2B4_HAELO|nr:hypothetical protein HPB48_018708 [Haemaphysalis longicornis]